MALPPRGSAQDRILEELHRRDRAERFTLAAMFMQMLGGILGVRKEQIEAMLSGYKDELWQLRYAPEYVKKQRQQRKVEVVKKVKNQLNDDALLKKLEGMSVPEETAPPKKSGARKR